MQNSFDLATFGGDFMELTNTALQTVLTGQNVVFGETPIASKNILHREGAGVVTLRGGSCVALYKISFGGNIAVPVGGTAEAISLAIAVNGEALQSALLISTPSAVGDFNNIYGSVLIKVPCGCCTNISVLNTSTQAVSVSNANLIIERLG